MMRDMGSWDHRSSGRLVRAAGFEAANLDVIGLTPRTIDVEHQALAHADVEAAGAGAEVGRAVDAGKTVKVEVFIRHPGWDALVDHVDRAADRRAAVEQYRRPAQYLDAVGGQRVDGDGVVG